MTLSTTLEEAQIESIKLYKYNWNGKKTLVAQWEKALQMRVTKQKNVAKLYKTKLPNWQPLSDYKVRTFIAHNIQTARSYSYWVETTYSNAMYYIQDLHNEIVKDIRIGTYQTA